MAVNGRRFLAMKKYVPILVALSLAGVFGGPAPAGAVSPSPVPEELAVKAAKGIKAKGEMVCLFQSGTEDVKQTISVGDILIVYRESKSHELKEVGKIKVLSYVRKDYLKGEVVEGELKAGDIAKKGDVASLIISSGDKCD
jgi:hypothetical protein